MKKEEFQSVMETLVKTKGPVTEDFLSAQVEKLKTEVEEVFGPGIYIKALIDRDNGGVLATFKRPTLGERYQVFVSCDVTKDKETDEDDENKPETKPKRKAKASTTNKKKDSDEDDVNTGDSEE